MLPDHLEVSALATPSLAAARAGGSHPTATAAPAATAPAIAAAAGSLEFENAGFRSDHNQQQQQQQQQQLPPHLARVLSGPTDQALEVHRRWMAGLTLAEAGALGDGIRLGVSYSLLR